MRHQPTLKTDATTAIIKVGSDNIVTMGMRAVNEEFLEKGMAYWMSLVSWVVPIGRLCLFYFLHVLGLVLCPSPKKGHLSIAFLCRILTSCQVLASVCESILAFLIFVS